MLLYGIDRLIEDKTGSGKILQAVCMTDEIIRLREEISEQITALKNEERKKLLLSYGCDISKPATKCTEAIQGYLFPDIYDESKRAERVLAMSLEYFYFLDSMHRELKMAPFTENRVRNSLITLL